MRVCNIVQSVWNCRLSESMGQVMGERKSKYTTRTVGAIKEALVDLLHTKPLADITITELARAAHISRSTFYQHFGNLSDVYDALMEEVSLETSPLMSQVVCQEGFHAAGKPFCLLVRNAGAYDSVIGEPRFLESFLAQGNAHESHDLYNIMVGAGYSRDQAKALCAFQLSGCFAAARMPDANSVDWAEIRPVIDRFILGGISACLAAKTRGVDARS